MFVRPVESRTVAPKNAESWSNIPHGSRAVREVGILEVGMAYFRKLKTGWRVEIERHGVRASRMFATKAAAQSWAVEEEAKIIKGSGKQYPDKTLAQALKRYSEEVSTSKRSGRSESLRFSAMLRDFPDLCGKYLHAITPADIGVWRDGRRRVVSDSSVVRESSSLKHLWNVAHNEWGWCGESPWKRVKMPKEGHARTRRTRSQEMKHLLRSMEYRTGARPTRPQHEVAYAYLVAHHTAMRAGEVLSLSRSTVDLKKRVVTLHSHKTLEEVGVRHVPFTRRALRLLRLLDGWAKDAERDRYFTISSQSLDVLFRKVRDRLLIGNLRFHDSRADALTRLSRRMDVLRLSKVSGHKDLNQLLNAYYRETAADIAATI